LTDELFEAWAPEPGVANGWNRASATHLLRRAGFGPEPGDVTRALETGFEGTFAALVDGDDHDPRLLSGADHLLATGSIELLQSWWTSLLLDGRAALRERVALMWHDVFATSHAKVDDVRMMHAQNQVFRTLGLGDFRELMHAVAKDPAMLVWLDGDDNRRGQPNENFARELMELFCLGIGNYSERDVQEAARAFSGWGTAGRSFVDRPEQHDEGLKRIFGQQGAFDGTDAVNLVLDHPACSRHVARRLLEEFLHPEPTEEETGALARFLVAHDWNVGEAIAHVLQSARFFSPRARRSRIAGPVEIVAISTRALGARVPPKLLVRVCEELGQSLFRPPSVKGWDGGERWIQASTWIARHNRLGSLASAHLDRSGDVRVDLAAAFAEVVSPLTHANVAQAVTGVLLPDGVPDDYRIVLVRAAKRAEDVDHALAVVTRLVVTSPEYHLI
jgi:uncharacterized protein (DUF1800 family)